MRRRWNGTAARTVDPPQVSAAIGTVGSTVTAELCEFGAEKRTSECFDIQIATTQIPGGVKIVIHWHGPVNSRCGQELA